MRLGLAWLLVAGCSTSTPAATPGASGAAGTAAPATSVTIGTASPSGPSIGPSSGLETPGSPSAPSAGASTPAPSTGWRTVVPPLAVPAAYLDFGFAGNGDLLVVGTDLITDPKLALWIARYTPDGTLVSKKAVDRRIRLINADWIHVDPTNDTVVFSEMEADGTFTNRRVSSATGKTTASVVLQDDVLRIAIDAKGRTFAVTPTYATSNTRRPCELVRLGTGGAIAEGVDGALKECETRAGTGGTYVFTSVWAIGTATSGNVLLVDRTEKNGGYFGPLRICIVTPGFGFVRSWALPFEWEPTDPPYGITFSSFSLAGTSDEQVYVGEVLVSEDGTHSTGNRIRHFGRTGTLLETLGTGGDQEGITWPTHPAVDSSDRLWVIDLDTASKTYSIKVRG